MNQNCDFCKIVRGEEPRHHVWEDEQFLVFLSHRPLRDGHALIIPKQHTDYIFDLDQPTFQGMFAVAKKLEPVLKKMTKAKRVGLAVEGFGQAHAHLHLIPMFGRGQLDSKYAHDESDENLAAVAEKFRKLLERKT